MVRSFRIFFEEKYNVNWVMPNVMEERNEITRQANDLNIKWQDIMKSLRHSKLEMLSDEMWDNMQNTDSNDPNLSWKELSAWTHRDWKSIVQVFEQGGQLPAPIVLVYKNIPYCVAGNTRLSICKLLNVQPQVLLINMDKL